MNLSLLRTISMFYQKINMILNEEYRRFYKFRKKLITPIILSNAHYFLEKK